MALNEGNMGQEATKSPAVHYLLLIGVTLFWAGAFSAAKTALREIPPFSLAALRFLIAGVILLAVLAKKEGLGILFRRETLYFPLLLGLIGVFGYSALLFWGVKLSTAINGSLIAGANPAATTGLAALFLGERITGRIATGIAVSFLGVAVVMTKGSFEVLQQLEFNAGDLLLLASLFCFALNSILAKKAMKHLSAWAVTASGCIVGSILLMPFAGAELASGAWGSPTPTTWICVVYLAVFASVLAYAWYFAAIHALGAGRASIFTNVVPIVGTAIAVAFVDEDLVPAHLVGAALVVGGVLVVTRSPRPVMQPAPRPGA